MKNLNAAKQTCINVLLDLHSRHKVYLKYQDGSPKLRIIYDFIYIADHKGRVTLE